MTLLPSSEPGSSTSRPMSPRDVGDLFAPFFRVAFTSAFTEEGELQAINQAEDFSTIPVSASTRVETTDTTSTLEIDSFLLKNTASNLIVESNAGSPFMFTLTLTPPYEDALRILNNPLVGWGALVKVQFGYVSNISGNNILSDVHLFRMNTQPKAEFGQDITITLSGMDLVASTGLRNISKEIYDRSEFPTDCSIVRDIATRRGISLSIDDSVGPDSSFLVRKSLEPPSVEAHKSDWEFIRLLCREHNLQVLPRGSTIHIFDLDRKGPEKPTYRFLWRTNPQTKRDIPVESISGNLFPMRMRPGAARGLLSLKTDMDTGKTMAKEIDGASRTDVTNAGAAAPSSESTTGNTSKSMASKEPESGIAIIDSETGKTVFPNPKPRPQKDRGDVASQPATANNADEKFAAKVSDAVFWSHPQVVVTSPGVVDVRPGLLVELSGTGRLYDGTYLVLKTKYDIGLAGFSMDTTLVRQSDNAPQGVKPTGKIHPVGETGDPEIKTETENSPRA